jgi:hypothetical protein
MSKFSWNPETVEHFKIESAMNALSGNTDFVEDLHKSIQKFVEEDCMLEDDETFEDLTLDLLELVLTSKSKEWEKFNK